MTMRHMLLVIVVSGFYAYAQGPRTDPRVADLISQVSAERLDGTVKKLASFGTRHTMSDPSSPTRGIGAARDWLVAELRAISAKLEVGFDTHNVAAQGRITRPIEVRNVMAVLPGRSARRIYITAHYDSLSLGQTGQAGSNTGTAAAKPSDPQLDRAFNHDADAPGANDNGSGTALTLELARLLAHSGLDFDATLVFALWAGEEQGLIGSGAHVQKLAADKTEVEANLNADIVGGSRGGLGVADSASVRVYSEGPEDSPSRSLARLVQRVAALYVPGHRVRLLTRQDRFARGSDHSSFNQHGFPALVFREAQENFSKQHGPGDTPDGVDVQYLARNTQVALAAAASLALAPPAPRVTPGMIGRLPSGYDASLRWTASPGAAAYRIYWREASTNDWQHSQLVGDVTEFVLPAVSIDDHVFGVAAVSETGHESLVSAYVARLRRDPEVKLVGPPQ